MWNYGAWTISRIILLLEFLLQSNLLSILIRIMCWVVWHLECWIITGIQINAEEMIISITIVMCNGNFTLLSQIMSIDLLDFRPLILRYFHIESFGCIIDSKFLLCNKLGFIGSCTRLFFGRLTGHTTSLRNLELVTFNITSLFFGKWLPIVILVFIEDTSDLVVYWTFPVI